MPQTLKPGDVLFSTFSGSNLHQKIVRQQKRASETLKEQARGSYAGKDAKTEDEKEKFTWSDEHVVHAGVCDNCGEVVEVGGFGVKHKQASGRDNIDKVIRFDSFIDASKVAILAGKIPRLHFTYPRGDVGIYIIGDSAEAPLVTEPAVLLDEKKLFKKVGDWEKKHGYIETDELLDKLEKRRKSKFTRTTISDVVKDAGIEERKGDKERLKPFICSHLVNAILYSALENLSLIAALSMKEFMLNPAQMYRRFIFNQGIWATHKAKDVGFNYKGNMYRDVF